jgi:endonuclease-8
MDALYDWSTDVMQDTWDAGQAVKKLRGRPEMLVCDALMDQAIFTGVGNVIKNETLFRIKINPHSAIGALNDAQLNALVTEARTYSFDFYRWEVEGTRRKKYCVHRKARCPDCKNRLVKEFTGLTPRSSFYCAHCQLLYTAQPV